MLDDPKSQRFIEDFLDQWLKLSEIDFTTPDPQLYPGPWLRDSMLAETRAFFAHMLEHDLDVMNFVDSDWAMLNAVLAEHYGILDSDGAEGGERVEGVAMRYVD